MPNTFNLANQIKHVNPVSSGEYYYGVWNSLGEAKVKVPIEVRREGRTVGIIEEGIVTEYWWRDGVEDDDLIKKETFSNNRPIKIQVFSQIADESAYNTKEELCAAAINSMLSTVYIGKKDVPFFNLYTQTEFIVFTLNGVETDLNVGGESAELASSQVQIITIRPLNTGSFDETTTQYIEVIASVAASDNIWERVNLDDYNVQPLSSGFTIFQKEVGGEVLDWLYRGESGAVGGNGYQTQQQDFQLLDSNESIVPTLQQVIDAGGTTTFASFPSGAEIEDDGNQLFFQNASQTAKFGFDPTGFFEIDGSNLKIKGSTSLDQGKILKVNTQGYFELDVEAVGYTSTNFDEDFAGKTTDDLLEGVNNKYNVQADYNQEDNTADDFIKNKPKPAFLSTTDGQINLGNTQGAYYNLTSPVDIISFTTTNKVAGGYAIIRINADTNDDPELVTVDGVTTGRKSSTDNWIDNEDMDLGIFVLPDLSIEWEFKPKEY